MPSPTFLLLLQVATPLPQAAREARVDSLFAAWNKPGSPGCALGVVRDGQVIYRKGYGTQNLTTRAPITTKSIFYMASVSKQFAAASVVLAALDGKLSLADEARRWVPELPAAAAGVTVGDLIYHLSGLRDYLMLWGVTAELPKPHTDSALLALLGRQQSLNFEPRSEWSYSNSGYVILTFILKRATGKSLSEYAEERLFQPLGMPDTHFHEDRTERHDPARQAMAYNPDGPKGRLEPGLYPEFDKVGDGGLYSTVEDFVRWDQNFETGTVGGRAFLTKQLEGGVLGTGDTLNYAAGLIVDRYKQATIIEHAGGFMGYRTEYLRFPDQRFSVICLCNLGTIDPATLARRIADIYLEAEFDRRLSPLVGVYHSDELDLDAEITLRRGRLYITRGGQPALPLDPVAAEYGARIKDGAERFSFQALGPMTVSFVIGGSGRADALTMSGGRAKNMRFVRQR
jgi:CubicO group peptidase (beta-lactamase class C family)